MVRVIFEILYKMIFCLSRVLCIGSIGGILGILLAVMFGHEEIFVWPGICLGAVVGGVLPFFSLFPSRGDHADSLDISMQIPPRDLIQPETSSPEISLEVDESFGAAWDFDFPDFF